jgi:hypothetical protein
MCVFVFVTLINREEMRLIESEVCFNNVPPSAPPRQAQTASSENTRACFKCIARRHALNPHPVGCEIDAVLQDVADQKHRKVEKPSELVLSAVAAFDPH